MYSCIKERTLTVLFVTNSVRPGAEGLRSRSQNPDRSVSRKEFRKNRRSETMISLDSKDENCVSDERSDRKPVKFLKNRGNAN